MLLCLIDPYICFFVVVLQDLQIFVIKLVSGNSSLTHLLGSGSNLLLSAIHHKSCISKSKILSFGFVCCRTIVHWHATLPIPLYRTN